MQLNHAAGRRQVLAERQPDRLGQGGAAAAAVPCVRRHRVRLSLRRRQLRGVQSIFQADDPREHRVHVPGEPGVRDQQAEAQSVPGVPLPKVSFDGNAEGGRAAGSRPRRPPEVPEEPDGRRLSANISLEHQYSAELARRHQDLGDAGRVRAGNAGGVRREPDRVRHPGGA